MYVEIILRFIRNKLISRIRYILVEHVEMK